MDKIKNVGLKDVGVTFTNEDGSSRRAIIERMNSNSKVYITREPSNKYDMNAIKVCVVDADGHDGQIGYIGKDYSTILAPMMDMGREFTASVGECGIYKNRPYCNIIVNEK